MSDSEQSKATILERALSFSSKEAREAYLQGVCGENVQLRARLDALVEAHFAANGVFKDDAPKSGHFTTLVEHVVKEGSGTKIGRYKLLEKIGEGGMGVVYMAEQQEPVRRRVALKIIKLGMDTRQVVARFEAERQALALMDHPNIAKVLDGGATESGRPYFVMELVRGVPITEYCDKNRLPTRPRLDLFVQVCHAIQHAHQKGVIHRDLKPTNILVTLNDGVPSPMVIDFGIAKATNQRLTEKTLFTNYATMIGTPAYMSPEQAEMSKLDVDTRTDIYSLGVLLYELLTGDTPFPSKNLLSVGYGEMQRIIAEQEPVRPSTRLSTMGHEERTVVARNRSLEASALGRLFRGDLDWIVMKCLEKDRTRRYETANGLALDIGRYVLNEPVLACPPSAAYRFQKLIRRNRIAFAAGSLVIAALTLGLVASTWQAIRARTAELQQVRMREKADQALANEAKARQAAEAARIAEREQRKQAEAIRYASDMSLAQQALKDGNFGRVWELLDRNRPTPGHEDLRGWEWRYLWQQSRPDEFIDLGRAEYMHGLALSRDRRWLAVAAHAGLSIRDISDLHAPHEIALLPTKPPGMVAFSPSENLLAYTSIEWDADKNPNTKLVLWNAETRTATATLTVTDWCSSVVFSADGRTLATLSGTWDPTAHLELWQIPSGSLIASHVLSPLHFVGGRNGMLALAPDLSWAAIAGRRLSVIDLSTAHERWGIDCDPDSNGAFNCLALSPDGKFLVSTGGRPASLSSIAVWDTASGHEIKQHGMDSRIRAPQVAFSPDGSTLVSSGGTDRAIQIWDSSDPTRMHLRGRPLRGHRSGAFYVVPARDGKTLITGSDDHSIYAWDIQHPPDEPNVATWTNVLDWAFGPDSESVVIFDREGELAQWQGPGMSTKTLLLKSSETDGHVEDNRLSDNGSCLAVAYTGGLIKSWDLRRHGELRQFSVDSKSPRLCGLSADSTKLLVYNDESQIAEWDVTKGRKLREWTVSRPLSSFRVDKGWNWLLLWKERPSDTLSILEFATGQRREVSSPLTRPMTMNFSDDGSLFAASSFLGYIRVWDTSSLREVCTLGGQQAPHYSISFSPDRTRVLAGCVLGLSFRLYDLKSKQELISVPGGNMPTWDARFSPDGNRIGALSKSTLHVHRAPTFAEIDAAEHSQRSSSTR